ncbi:MAG: hypothetical protein EPN31_14105 [Castellaniella sp.]|uniref:hypothetical protein n=1 Tax=Castellaniella sp. TaxID=1955812 RepID=UPI0012287921|nr:hypothetical protein [Castellaniella sp.]TAN26047.1 MAG: hypothetical protein EPN31_14105 [Castellaniella sp.]
MKAREKGKTDGLRQLLEYLGSETPAQAGSLLIRFAAAIRAAKDIKAICLDEKNGISYAIKAIEAMQPLDPFTVLHLALTEQQIEERLRNMRKDRATKGAVARHQKKNGKDKGLVRELWLEWQKEPGKYVSKASFDRDMLDKVESVASIKTITKWRVDLQKEQALHVST